ncbi:GH35 family endo-1,4-beta-xylanase [Alteromonadaceae bacterium 2753L.S.0a.02]|nr:GH35 family endo-1,4-beta-xylanase [Alteromonadaceae bacterium 2753L.S.0a.02]
MKRFLLGATLLAAVSYDAMAGVQEAGQYTCGYSLSTGTYNVWNTGYQAYVNLKNEYGITATDFDIYLDVGNTSIVNGWQGSFSATEGGYLAEAPFWLFWQKIPTGSSYSLGFVGSGTYSDVTPYVISINGQKCDTVAPLISLSASSSVVTSAGPLTLTADASDNVALLKVVFMRDGQVISQDYDAPYEFTVNLNDGYDGKNIFTAQAIDISGNVATASSSPVYVAIGSRFLGSAPGSANDFVDMVTYFNQLTPENAGKWGSVEAERDVMNWDAMDTAYAFALENDMPIKLHTLVWGQQAPAWIDDLTPEEQLAEVEEWFAALAARYPDAEMIDVVNEPLHAPASFREALGGAGDTGWDWVIKSFEMARQYFPNAQLLLNDYNILILENFTSNYLAVVDVLNERGLLDGIGVQAHFLERADLETVEANVASLAATGLPIYVSELDVDFADDARQANRLADLFTIFWNNPSVVGVTHWGHAEGDIWRESAYLIRQDGTLRPSMQWLQCFYAGGTDCYLPEYVPAGWEGTDSGLTLQAELYDDAKGVAPLGDNVTYTDGGDWFSFAKVHFNENWNLFALNYSKGADTETTVSVHLDSLDSPAIIELPLTNTGGWGTAVELEAELPAISGVHDVYFKFNGDYTAGNIDYVRFGAPVGFGPELINNGDFEDGNANAWYTWSNGTLSATTDVVYEGSYALQVLDRAENAPAAINITSLVSAGNTYQLSMMASISGEDSASLNVTLNVDCPDESSYDWIVSPTAIANGEWVELAAQFTLPECEISNVQFFVENGNPANIHLDNVSLRGFEQGSDTGLLSNPDFESGNTSGWFTWDGTLAISTDVVYEGSNALLLTDRSGEGSPAATSLMSVLSANTTYNLSLAVTTAGAETSPARAVLKTSCEGEDDQYSWVANTSSIVEGEWTVLSGEIAVPDCTLTDLLLYVEGPGAGVDLYLDNVIITE